MPSRHRKLDTVVASLQLTHGPQALRRTGDAETVVTVPCISTTFPELDAALIGEDAPARGLTARRGGVPRSRITEIMGPATSGKVTVAAKIVAAAHRERGALAAWIDLGRTCDPDYLHRCGVDLDRLLVVRPEAMVDALAITLHLVESNSLAALVFDYQLPGAGNLEKTPPGALEQLALAVTRTRTAVVFMGEPDQMPASLAHAAAVRLRFARERWVIRQGDVKGYEGSIEIIKNRMGRPGVVVPLRITFNGTVRGESL